VYGVARLSWSACSISSERYIIDIGSEISVRSRFEKMVAMKNSFPNELRERTS
jgi:hypothetical protein